MGVYVNSADFTGKYSITKNDFDAGKLDLYIDDFEIISLQELFGVELYDLWVIGIAASDPIYTKLRDAFTEQLDCGIILNSRGIKNILLGLVYFQYKTDGYTQPTITANVKSKNENAENANLFTANIQSRYNESIETYKAIQGYICDNLDVYPTFKGIEKSPLIMF
jgi:hypothetical protein